MPWLPHIEQWKEASGVEGNPSENCTDEEISNLYMEHLDENANMVFGKDTSCAGLLNQS